MTDKLTDAQFDEIIAYREHPDEARHLWSNSDTLRENLVNGGYITEARDDGEWRHWNHYKLTDKGRATLDEYVTAAKAGDFDGMSIRQRDCAATDILDPANPDDLNTLYRLADHDRSGRVRRAALDAISRTLDDDGWRRFAHDLNSERRMLAVGHVGIGEYADEPSNDVLAKAVDNALREGESIPHDLVVGWYRRGLVSSVKAMTADDIDMVLDDGRPEFVAQVAARFACSFTTGQVEKFARLRREHPKEERFAEAMRQVLANAKGLPESIVKEGMEADDWIMRGRLFRFREAYREYVRAAAVFADLGCELAREQMRLALEDE